MGGARLMGRGTPSNQFYLHSTAGQQAHTDRCCERWTGQRWEGALDNLRKDAIFTGFFGGYCRCRLQQGNMRCLPRARWSEHKPEILCAQDERGWDYHEGKRFTNSGKPGRPEEGAERERRGDW